MFNQIVAREDNVKSFRFDLDGSDLKPFFDTKNKNVKQNYVLFYGSNQPPFERVGDEKKDLDSRIFHLFIGEERGILKKIQFSREDNPRIRASNIQLSNPAKQQDRNVYKRKI